MPRSEPPIEFARLLRLAAALVQAADGMITVPEVMLKRAENKDVMWSVNEDGSESLWIVEQGEHDGH